MWELTIEEKAKRYDDAINRMKYYVVDEYGCSRIKVADVFPELKESNDERIRKSLIELFKDMEWDDSILHDYNMDKDKTIAWLEKQGEQKQEWSKDDENEYDHILKTLNLVAEEQETKGYNNLISTVNWFKSIKDRIQSKQSNKQQGKSAIEANNEENVECSKQETVKYDKIIGIKEAIIEMEKYMEGITECPNPYHDPDIEALKILIDFAKSKI